MPRPAPTPQTIHDQIHEAKRIWFNRVAVMKVPTAMYLGRMEDAALDAYAQQYIKVHDPSLVGHRQTYEGMQIFVVDADSHIDFGWAD